MIFNFTVHLIVKFQKIFVIFKRYTERKIYLNLFRTKKNLLVLQPKRIFLCNKEKCIRFKHLLLYFKDPLLKSKDPVI